MPPMSHPFASTMTRTALPGWRSEIAHGRRVARALFALTKPRLATMSVLTTAVAYVAARPTWSFGSSAVLLLGTALSAAGALALNQWRERDTDCVMTRTSRRPLPQHELTPAVALAWSAALAVSGVAVLAAGVNGLAAALSAATIVVYAFVYTPLKRRTRWATEVGAISGALPPLIGWAAAEGGIGAMGWWLFAVLFFWQMPHFFAIGWVCRRDYCAAGFPLLPAADRDGRRTARWSLAYATALVMVSLVPVAVGACGLIFALVATGAGGAMAYRAWQFVRATDDRESSARRLFLASLAYVPLVLIALVVERCR